MKCFVIAMQSEAQPVIDNMNGVLLNKVYGKILYTGELCGQQTAVLVCGVGKVNAACGAQYLIDKLNASCIINVGFAGAVNGGCETGGIYEIEKAVQYDFDLVQLNGTPIGTLNEFKDRWLKLATCGLYPAKKLATGDRFNDSEFDYNLISRGIRADVRDMEGAAVAQVCIHAGVPFYSFKVISDLAKSGSTTEQFLSNIKLCADNLRSNVIKIFNGI